MHQLRRNCVLLILTGSYIVIHTYHAVISTVPHDNYSIYIYRSKFTEGMKVKMQFFLLKNPNLITGLRVLCNIMISIQGSMLSTSAVTMRLWLRREWHRDCWIAKILAIIIVITSHIVSIAVEFTCSHPYHTHQLSFIV